MKTILTICCHVDLCGAVQSMLSVLKCLKLKGYRIILLIPSEGKIEQRLHEIDIEYYIVPINFSATMYNPPFKNYFVNKIYWGLYFLKQEIFCDIQIIKELRKHKIRPNLIYTNTIIPTAGILLSLIYKIPHIIHIRELSDEDFHFNFYIGKNLYLKILNKSITYAICISQAVKNKFLPYFKTKTKLIYNGVPYYSQTDFSEEKEQNKIKILFVGRLSKEKGILDIIYAINNLKESGYSCIELDIWGEGIDRPIIINYIKEHKLEDVIFLKGYCPANKIPRHQYDIAIMSSPYEAFGRVTIEYMMAGLPVIGRNGGATPEIIKENETGMLYNSKKELIDKLKYLINNKEYRLQIGEQGKKQAIENFSEQRYTDEIMTIFNSVLNNP